MKIPKRLKIFGYNWKVRYKKEDEKSGGSFDWKKKEIVLDTEYGEQESIFIHELMEAILTELHFRFYGQEGNMPYTFHFDHDGLCKFHKAFFQALKDNKII